MVHQPNRLKRERKKQDYKVRQEERRKAYRIALDYSYHDLVNGDVCWTQVSCGNSLTFIDVVYGRLKVAFGEGVPVLGLEYGEVLNGKETFQK